MCQRGDFSQMVSVCAVAVQNESTQTTASKDLSIACFIEFKFWGLEYVLFMFCGVFFLAADGGQRKHGEECRWDD